MRGRRATLLSIGIIDFSDGWIDGWGLESGSGWVVGTRNSFLLRDWLS